MSIRILTVALRQPADLVAARQRARQLAEALGFANTEQIAIATSVSEIARNALRYAGGGRVEFEIGPFDGRRHFVARVVDSGPGIPHLDDVLSGRYVSESGMGLGLVGAKRLMDRCDIATVPGEGTTVTLAKTLPVTTVDRADLGRIAERLPQLAPPDSVAELQLQNRELMNALAELSRRQDEVTQMAHELEDTNRGVMALYAELDEKAASLRRADETKTRFLSNMSHEFRTPLSSVRALAKLLLSHADGPLQPEQETQVRFIAKAVDTLTDLVNDLLDIAKIEAGKVDVVPADFHVEELFSTLRGMMRPLLVGNVELVFDSTSTLPAMYTDDGKVAQILRNFISNALKFTERGSITVSAHVAGEGRTMQFAVEDTGIGIEAEHRDAIFEEFVQVPGAHQTKVKGTGLGLPLCRKLATLLGGSVTVESTPGKGSVFFATIPVRIPGGLHEVPVKTARDAVSHGFILVVEPDERVRVLLEASLKETGYEPFCVDSVARAKDVMESVRPAAVVLAGSSGAEQHQALRWLGEMRASGTGPVPVIVASPEADRARALEAGADWHVTTPIDAQALGALLERLLLARRETSPVLIIDDDEAARYVLRKLLNTESRVEEASDGTRGMELAERWKPRWIFLDLNMPGLQGDEVLDRLKADPRTADIPVVIVTAKELAAGERERLGARVKAIIPKGELSREILERAMRNMKPLEDKALILGVDDNEAGRYAKCRILRLAGFEVIEAATGEDALRLARERHPELMLIDVRLPDVNGRHVSLRIKSDPATSDIAILQTSATHTDTHHKVLALEAGADAYLTEPVEPDELVANVRALLRMRRAETKLHLTEARFRHMAEAIGDVFWVLDPVAKRFIYVSPAFESMWGRPVAEVLEDSSMGLGSIHPDDRERAQAAFRKLLDQKRDDYDEEFRIVRGDGEVRWIACRAFPMPDERGARRVAGIAQDITERRLANDALRDLDRRKDEFLAMLAHELRNPLGPIRNAVEIMRLAPADRTSLRDDAREMIGRQVTHLSRLVDDLLDVSRITQGKVTLQRSPVKVSAVIEAAMELARPSIDATGHRLEVKVPAEPLWINADPVRMTQVVGNLLNNAAKFTPPSGQISIAAEAEGGEVTIRVEDTGIGIPEDVLPRIFDLFAQGDRSLDRSRGGLGIGLSLVKQLVGLHGGRVAAHSAGTGQGSRLEVVLPLIAAPEATVSAAPQLRSSTGRRVLVVDDSRDSAESLSVLLEQAGHTVATAFGAHEAIAKARIFAPEVVFLDIGLPEMDGYELARRLRELPETKAARLFALTGYGQAADRELALDAGFDDHFVKPFDPVQLQRVTAG